MRTSPRRVSVLCALALVATACSSGTAAPDATPSTPASTETSEPSPTASEDPFAMPDPVTKEYVDRVVNTIYEEWGAITRELLEEPADPTAITPIETRKRMEELFQGEYLQQRFEEADDVLRGDRAGLRPPSTSSHHSTGPPARCFVANARCIVAVGRSRHIGHRESRARRF